MFKRVLQRKSLTTCPVCDDGNTEAYPPNCSRCWERYPYALLKAVCDPFSYAASIQGLGIVEFESARIRGDWVVLFPGYNGGAEAEFEGLHYPFPRGIGVPLASILWIADAPRGS